MMTNLFSIFEPSSSIFNLSLNWSSTLLGIVFIPYLYWSSPSRWSLLWSKIILTLYNEFKALLTSYHSKSILLFISMFTFIVFNNFLGLLPYVFTSSSHISMTLSLSLPLWITLMIFGWMNHTQHMFAHLVPQGTPSLLMPFMVLIETISNLIRPGTLAVRLAANMIAGHLLLTLLGNTGSSLSFYLLLILIFSQILLLVLEAAVAIIQSYVFAVLSTLYTSEIN
uniref:ATP synthase F0 subunit 6 n=1 Tax=Quadrella coronata TaxID=652071 RepID=UPI0028D8FCE2|nr:ATP synthase F0 subunit 6 [Quadrella coronata]WMQ53289.1 ATP synthase F0 subunit 6 [Quadrella coronata]